MRHALTKQSRPVRPGFMTPTRVPPASTAALARRLFAGRSRSCRWGSRLFHRLADRDDLDLLIDRRRGLRGIEQLLLAEADGLQAFDRDLEGIRQDVADRVGAALAQDHVRLALAVGFDMAD